jgi:hypothetical protein
MSNKNRHVVIAYFADVAAASNAAAELKRMGQGE